MTMVTVKQIATEMMEEKEDGAYIPSPLDGLIEELYIQLRLDCTFNGTEIKRLKSMKFKVNKEHDTATKTYKKVPITLQKENINLYILKLGKGRKGYTIDLDDLNEAGGTDLNNFVTDYLNEYYR